MILYRISNDHQIDDKNQSAVGEDSAPWCRLISQQVQDKSFTIWKPEFIVGSEENCDLVINHPDSPVKICKIFQHKAGKGEFFPKIQSGDNTVVINNYVLGENSSCYINSGEELIFKCGLTTYSYIFQQLRGNTLPKGSLYSENESTFPDHLPHLASSPNLISLTNSDMPQYDGEVSFINFPYYLSNNTERILVVNTALHMDNLLDQTSTKQLNYDQQLKMLLSGPAGSQIYQEKLCKALAHFFGSKCLVLDSLSYPIMTAVMPEIERQIASECDLPSSFGDLDKPSFRIGDRVVYTGLNFGRYRAMFPSRGPAFGSRGKIVLYFGGSYKVGVEFDKAIAQGIDLGDACRQGYGFFCNVNEVVLEPKEDSDYEILLSSLFLKAIESVNLECPLFLFITDIVKFLEGSSSLSSPPKTDKDGDKVATTTSKSVIDILPKHVVVIGSQTCTDENTKVVSTPQLVADMFTCQIGIDMPEDEYDLEKLKRQFEADTQHMIAVRNKKLLQNIIKQRGLKVEEDNELFFFTHQVLTVESAQTIIERALGYHVTHNPRDSLKPDIVLSRESISYAISILKGEPTNFFKLQSIQTEDDTEKKILRNLILLGGTGVKFDDIGALGNIKDVLRKMVMLPLQRHELLSKGLGSKACKGVLLFGPPGTGKTMLAKAVATETGANFISISFGNINSEYSLKYEEHNKAVLSLATKLAPCVIFISEADSVLRRSSNSEKSKWRKVKNDFMSKWALNDHGSVFVFLATDRPFHLDDDVVEMLPLRLMVNLPDASNRSEILKVILAMENLSPDVNFDEIANMTSEYSGSDLKNLCDVAAYRPVREITIKAKQSELIGNEKKENDKSLSEGKLPSTLTGVLNIRPLNMDDFRYAKERISPRTPSESLKRLQEWNKRFGGPWSGNDKLMFSRAIQLDNKFESRILRDAVITSSKVGVKFSDIGALDYVKGVLKELVMLPLKRPRLFSKGQLRKVCKGILLFGLPGTGKTMLAKAVATEAGANFINLSEAVMSSKSISESIQYVEAIFSVASNVAPTIIFIDEVDKVLKNRDDESVRKVINEIMMNWDCLAAKGKERVLVIAATERPFDLDDAVLRRLPCRLLVNLPDVSSRSRILDVILAEEDISPDFDCDELANMTLDYSGRDLKNLCVIAAYRPLREIIEKETMEKEAIHVGQPFPISNSNDEIRPLNMDDFRYASEQVTASLPSKSKTMKQLLDWNNKYGQPFPVYLFP